MKYRDQLSGKEMVETLGLTRQRINQLEHKGCDMIRSSPRATRILELYDMPTWEKQNPFIAAGFGSWKRSGYSRPERLAIWSVDGDV